MRFDFEQIFPASAKSTQRARYPERIAAAAPLDLPVVSEGIPTTVKLKTVSCARAWELLLLAIAEVHPLPPSLLQRALGGLEEPTEIARLAVGHFLTSKCRDHLGFHLDVTVSDQLHDSICSSYDHAGILSNWNVDPLKPHLFLSTSEWHPQGADSVRRLMEPVFKDLKTESHRALYWEAYRLLEWSQDRFVTFASPSKCKEIAERHYWQGCESEIGWEAEMRELLSVEEIEETEFKPSYTLRKLKQSFGPAIYQPRARIRHSQKQLEALSKSDTDPQASKLAQAILFGREVTKAGLKTSVPSLWGADVEPIGFSSFIRWNLKDDTYRIVDDFANDTMNSGANITSTHGVYAVSITSIKQARQFVLYINQMFAELDALDDLICAVSTPDTSNDD